MVQGRQPARERLEIQIFVDRVVWRLDDNVGSYAIIEAANRKFEWVCHMKDNTIERRAFAIIADLVLQVEYFRKLQTAKDVNILGVHFDISGGQTMEGSDDAVKKMARRVKRIKRVSEDLGSGCGDYKQCSIPVVAWAGAWTTRSKKRLQAIRKITEECIHTGEIIGRHRFLEAVQPRLPRQLEGGRYRQEAKRVGASTGGTGDCP